MEERSPATAELVGDASEIERQGAIARVGGGIKIEDGTNDLLGISRESKSDLGADTS